MNTYLEPTPAQHLRCALNRTYRFHPAYAARLFSKSDSLAELTGELARCYGNRFDLIFNRPGIKVVTAPNPVPGCKYFEVPIAKGEALTDYCHLWNLLGASGDHKLWAIETKLGYRLWTESFAIKSIEATSLRFVTGHTSLKPLEPATDYQKNEECVIWDWYPYDPCLINSNLRLRANNYDELVEQTQAHPELALVRQKRINYNNPNRDLVNDEDRLVIARTLADRKDSPALAAFDLG